MSEWISRIGAGPDLVLIHGWAMHGGIFAPLAERLSARFRLHLVDMPGHGFNQPYRPGALQPTELALRIAEATPPAHWIGWSLGGLVAMQGALDHPEQVRGLVSIAANPCFVSNEDWPHAVAAKVFADFGEALIQDFSAAIERFLALETLGSAHAQDELRQLKAQVFAHGQPDLRALQDGLALLERMDVRADLAELAVPSLWIAGRRDRLVPSSAMQWAAMQSPHGRFLQISAGHAPFLSHADEVAQAITAFAETGAAA